MAVDTEQPASFSTEDSARACAKQASRQQAPTRKPDPCYELFRCAFASPPDTDVWRAILDRYRKLVLHWLGQYAGEDAVQEVFLRFWQTQQNATSPFTARFPNIGAVMGYLKSCAAAVRIEAWRNEDRQRLLCEKLRAASSAELILARVRPNRGHTSFDFKQLVLSRLKGERERAVFEGTYYYDLAPRDIQAERPDLFPDVRMVYRVKDRLLRRLQRDRELWEFWPVTQG
jgi:DNA-directed RNA polymerase specialized sigma24 family protein